MRRTVVLTLTAACLVAAGLPVSAEGATPSFTRTALSTSVSGTSVSVSTTVKARSKVVVKQYGVCVRDSSKRILDFSPKAKDVSITTTGTAYGARGAFDPGTYAYFPCVRQTSGWTAVGAPKHFTVVAPTPSSPPPVPLPTPSPSPTPGPSETPSASPSPPPSPSPTPAPSSPAPSGPPSTGGAVLFRDDFEGTGDYDHTRWGEWSACTYNGSVAYGGIGCGDRARLDGQGHLSIPATPNVGTSLSTAGRFDFTYGTITARMMVPTQVGYWPAFWTLNNNPTGRPNSATVGEVDVIEAYTTFGDGYRRATHHYTPAGSWSSRDDPLCAGFDIRGGWHDYSAKVEPGQVTFYVDGRQCGPAESSADPEALGGGYAFGPDHPAGNWLLLTLAIGGAGGQQKPATENAQLLVDSVTVTGLGRGRSRPRWLTRPPGQGSTIRGTATAPTAS